MANTLLKTSDGTMLKIKDVRVEYPFSVQGDAVRSYRVVVNAEDILFRSEGMASADAHLLLTRVQNGGVFDERLNKLSR